MVIATILTSLALYVKRKLVNPEGYGCSAGQKHKNARGRKDLIRPRSRAYFFKSLRPSAYSADGVSGVPVIIRVTSMPIWTHL